MARDMASNTERVTKRKLAFGTSMGVSSIIAILVILVLVVFSALSITTSKADLKLSQKTSDGVVAFFEADAAAEEMMAEISSAIAKGTGWKQDLAALGCEVSSSPDGGTLIAYTISVDRFRNLNVELISDEDGKLTRSLWQIVPANEWVPDNSLNLFMPG
jgi:hypothetical protein